MEPFYALIESTIFSAQLQDWIGEFNVYVLMLTQDILLAAFNLNLTELCWGYFIRETQKMS